MKNQNAFDDIYALVKLIPYGRVSSYGAIVAYLGMKGGARMVGWAMNASHTDPKIPAHRVVNRNGVLTGKNFFGEGVMQKLLESEGLVIQEDQIIFHARSGFILLQQICQPGRFHCASHLDLNLPPLPLAFIQADDDSIPIFSLLHGFDDDVR